MDLINILQERRSIRKYLPDEISDEIINKLIYAAQTAPSGGNCQPWHFYVIKSKDIRMEIIAKSCRQEWLKTAPLMIVICADPVRSERYGERGKNLYCIQDTAAAIQNILLCAKSLNLGTCWCGAFNEDELKKILKLKENMRPVAVIPVGYTNDSPKMPARRPINEIMTIL